MFIIRKQFRTNIVEREYSSESQAIITALKEFNSGGWQYVCVISTELDETILELGETQQSAVNKVLEKTRAKEI